MDPAARIVERRRRHLVRRRERGVADAQRAAVGQRPPDVEDRSARARLCGRRAGGRCCRGRWRPYSFPPTRSERLDESVIEFTVPIEAEATATGAPVAIATSELASGTPAGLQLSASSQSELTAPVHVDVLIARLPYLVRLPYLDCHACPALGQREFVGHRATPDELEPLPETAIISPCGLLSWSRGSRYGDDRTVETLLVVGIITRVYIWADLPTSIITTSGFSHGIFIGMGD